MQVKVITYKVSAALPTNCSIDELNKITQSLQSCWKMFDFIQIKATRRSQVRQSLSTKWTIVIGIVGPRGGNPLLNAAVLERNVSCRRGGPWGCSRGGVARGRGGGRVVFTWRAAPEINTGYAAPTPTGGPTPEYSPPLDRSHLDK